MKIAYTIPSIHVNLKDIKLPTQDTTSDVNVEIGSSSFNVEGDVAELVTYMKEAVSVVKDVTAWAVTLPELFDKTFNPGKFDKDGSAPFED